MPKETFDIILACGISENKDLVLSKNSRGDLVLATRAVIRDNGRVKYYYDKGAIVIAPEFFEDFKLFSETVREHIL